MIAAGFAVPLCGAFLKSGGCATCVTGGKAMVFLVPMAAHEHIWPQLRAGVESSQVTNRADRKKDSWRNLLKDPDMIAAQVEEMTAKLAGRPINSAALNGTAQSEDPSATAELDAPTDATDADDAPEHRAASTDVRWMKVRLMTLEKALDESRSEAQTLTEYVELCFDVIQSQDDRNNESQKKIRAEIERLISHNGRHDRELFELRANQNASRERMDALAAELLELAHRTGDLAAKARSSADMTAEETESLALELREASKQTRALATKAKDRAQLTAEEAKHAAAELRQANKDAKKEAQEAARKMREANEEARKIAEDAAKRADEVGLTTAELREANEKTRELAADATKRAQETQKEAEKAAKGLREANKEAKHLAELAAKRADEIAADVELAAKRADEAELTTAELREATEKNRDAALESREIAATAKEQALSTHDVASRAAQELREANEEAKNMAVVAAERAEQAVLEAEAAERELRESHEEARKIALAAQERAEEIAREAEVAERELREANEETRVMAEKAKDRADFAADSAAGLQVDFEEETESIRQSLENIDADEAARANNAAISLREEIERELRELRSKLAIEPTTDDGAGESDTDPSQRKRWKHHLRGDKAPPVKELSAPADDAQAASK